MKSSLLSAAVILGVGAGCSASNPSIDSSSTDGTEASVSISVPTPAPALADNATITRIAFASCADEELPQPIWKTIAADNPQLYLFTGDNVYADINESKRIRNPGPADLAFAWNALAKNKDFTDFYSKVPMMVTWDDHDFGKNDAGANFAPKETARNFFLDFFSIDRDSVGKDGQGIYHSRIIGEEGKRVQIIMLDTRWFRGPLKRTDEWGAKGKERYLPSDSDNQVMLGEDQWTWLEEELQKDADMRIVVSSIQMIADSHGWEAWRALPAERDRLYKTLGGAKGGRTVVISGDRHVGGLYRDASRTDFPIYEITASSLNLSFNDSTAIQEEREDKMLGLLYGPENYGLLDIDWEAELLSLSLKGLNGKTVRSVTIPFGEISTGDEARSR